MSDNEGTVTVSAAVAPEKKGRLVKYTVYAVILVVGVFVAWHTNFDFDTEAAKGSLNTGADYVGEAATAVGDSASELYDNLTSDDPSVEAPVTSEETTE